MKNKKWILCSLINWYFVYQTISYKKNDVVMFFLDCGNNLVDNDVIKIIFKIKLQLLHDERSTNFIVYIYIYSNRSDGG